jgi:hypothetical protein
VTFPHPAVARQVPLEAGFPAAPVQLDSVLLERPDSQLLERPDLPPLERPDSPRVKLRAEPFVVAREIAQAKLA